jgi:hypothetical protein
MGESEHVASVTNQDDEHGLTRNTTRESSAAETGAGSGSTTSDIDDSFHAPGLAPMTFAVYGEDWFRDNTGLLTNAIRRELRDLYTIYCSMISRRSSLEKDDVESFFRWWKAFSCFLQVAMSLIDGTIIPWLERWQELPEVALLEKHGGRMKVGKDIVKISQKIASRELAFYTLSPAKAVSKLSKVLGKWTRLVDGYLTSLDESSAIIVEKHYSLQECLSMDRFVADRVMQSKDHKVNIVLLVRNIEKRPQTLAFWKNQNLDLIPRLCHPYWWNLVAKDHFEYVTYFDRRYRKSFRSEKPS